MAHDMKTYPININDIYTNYITIYVYPHSFKTNIRHKRCIDRKYNMQRNNQCLYYKLCNCRIAMCFNNYSFICIILKSCARHHVYHCKLACQPCNQTYVLFFHITGKVQNVAYYIYSHNHQGYRCCSLSTILSE